MIVIIGSDHGGFPLKESLKKFMAKEGFEVKENKDIRVIKR